MSGLQIWSDQENSMQTNNGKESQGTKRTAFGQLTNNQVRRQPARAAKSAGAFTVFEDKENPVPAKPKNAKRNPVLAAVSKPPAEKLESKLQPAVFDSPMAIDESILEADTLDRDELLHCLPEYQEDIHDYLREAELRFRPKPNYMRKQTDISCQMRTILVDWLVEVGEEYKLHDETLHLAVNYIDRFLSQMSVLRGKLQLVGTACMYIASKYEEIYPPDVGEFVYITDDTYTKKQLLRMEHLVIKVLGFDVATPTAHVFSELYSKQLSASERVQNMAKYIMELSLLDSDKYLVYTPSMISSSALFLAAHILGELDMAEIERVTRYRQSQVQSCVHNLLATMQAAPSQAQQAVRDKYKSDSRRAVASIPIPDMY